jgi:hypothetical protein
MTAPAFERWYFLRAVLCTASGAIIQKVVIPARKYPTIPRRASAAAAASIRVLKKLFQKIAGII